MSGDAAIGSTICPECQQYVSSDDYLLANKAITPSPSNSKRQSGENLTSIRKRLRGSVEKSNVVWEPGLPVWVRTYDDEGNRGWEPGLVHCLQNTSVLGC